MNDMAHGLEMINLVWS